MRHRLFQSWLLPIGLTTLLFLGYLVAGLNHEESAEQYLKGLTLLQHFGIHFVTGVFFGLLFIIGYRIFQQKRAYEPVVLFITIALSHWPDIRFAYRKLPHDQWEIIFLLHTVVDEVRVLFWVLLVIDIVLATLYFRLLKIFPHQQI